MHAWVKGKSKENMDDASAILHFMIDFAEEKLYLHKVGKRRRQVVLEEEEVNRIMGQYHDNAGHFGIHTTEENIASHYYWPRMREYVKDYVSI